MRQVSAGIRRMHPDWGGHGFVCMRIKGAKTRTSGACPWHPARSDKEAVVECGRRVWLSDPGCQESDIVALWGAGGETGDSLPQPADQSLRFE